MNIYTIMHTMMDTIHDDSATQTWSATNYARNHSVFLGADVRNPPGEATAPNVIIYPVTKDTGFAEDLTTIRIGVVCEISDESDLATGKALATEKSTPVFTPEERAEIERLLQTTRDPSGGSAVEPH